MKSNALLMNRHLEYLKTDQKSKAVVKEDKVPFVVHLLQFGFRFLGPIFPRYSGQLAYKLFTTPRSRARHKKSDRILEQARLFEFMSGSTILKGYEWGSGEKTCLLVHGWESRGTALRSFVPDLVEKGFRVVAFDAPAHGHSAGNQTNLLHFSNAIRSIIHHVGTVDAVIAHSFGGSSTVFALSYLDNEIELDKLVLIASPSRMDRALEFFSKFMKMPKSVYDQLKNILEEKTNTRLDEISLTKAYPKLKVGQTLLIHDKNDPVVPFSAAESIYKSWDHINFLITEDLGHFQLMKNPHLIEKVIDFVE